MALKPHLTKIVNACISYGSEHKESAHYFGLMRSLFRTVVEGKFDSLYQEFHPLLPDLLRWLNRLLSSSHDSRMKDIFAELCLTVPVRLPALTPFLELIMRPLIWSLHSSHSDLVSQGLSTFNSLIHNLSADFIDPMPPALRQNLISSVRGHIQSVDSNKSMIALQILGKLAGSNRKFLYDDIPTCPPCSYTQIPHPTQDIYKLCTWDWAGTDVTDCCLLDGFTVEIFLKPDHQIPIELGKSIYFAYKQLHMKASSEYEKMQQQKAAHFILTCLGIYLNEAISIDDKKQEESITYQMNLIRQKTSSINNKNNHHSDQKTSKKDKENVNNTNHHKSPHENQINKEILKTLLSGIIIVHSNKELEEFIMNNNEFSQNNMFNDICRHFALLYIHKQQIIDDSSICTNSYLSPLIFIDTIIELITNESGQFIDSANEAIKKLFDYCSILMGKSPSYCSELSWCKYLINQLVNQCYESEWYKKYGACKALLLIIQTIYNNNTNDDHIQMNDDDDDDDHDNSSNDMKLIIPLAQGLLYSVKNSSQDIILQRNQVAVDAFQLLFSCAVRIYKRNTIQHNLIFRQLIELLMNELSGANKIARKLVKDSFSNIIQIEEDKNKDNSSSEPSIFYSIMETSSTNAFTQLFSKSFIELPIEHQIGNIDAITYFFQLKPPILPNNEKLLQLLKTALTIAEIGSNNLKPNYQQQVAAAAAAHAQMQQQQQAQQSQQQPLNKGNMTTAKIGSIFPQLKQLQNTQQIRHSNKLETELIQSCIELLSIASCEFLKENEHKDFRNQIIGVFFKTLTLSSSPIVESAKKGLAKIIAQHKLPKDLLQISLRPILLDLAEYKKLNVSLLQGLSRLLELLTNCFNVTLGDKLLEHLQYWKDPQNLTIWKDNEAIEIASSIIHIFHLLPVNAALKFLEQLVTLIIALEKTLPRNISSPYRKNLILYLNKYPKESIQFFFERIKSIDHCKMFQLILRSESASPLRDTIANNPDQLIQCTFDIIPEDSFVSFQGIQIIKTLIKFQPKWIIENPIIIKSLLKIWCSNGRYVRLNEDSMRAPLYYLRESKIIIKCFLHYCKNQNDDSEISILLYMLDIFRSRTTVDYTFLKEYCKKEIVENTNIEKKRKIIETYLQFSNNSSTIDTNHRVQILRVLINPLLKKCFKRQEAQQIFQDNQLMSDIIKNILSSSSSKSIDQPSPQEEALSIELLRLATLLVQFIPTLLVQHRKELLRFAWNQLKSEDATNKQCANVLVCRFIEAYDTPPRNVLQVFIALLHYYQVEARQLVRKALDILTPMLKIRIPEENERLPTWIKWTKKILVEEGHTLPQLIHILQLLVRHPDLFYPCKGHFVPQIVSSLPRIGLLSSCPPDNKKLTIDLVELIINWEKRRLKSLGIYPSDSSSTSNDSDDDDQSNSSKSNQMMVDSESTTNASSTSNNNIVEDGYKPTEGYAIVATNFLVRIVSTTEIRDGSFCINYIQRAQDLLREAFKIWPTVSVKLSYLENILDTKKQKSPMIQCGLQILEVILEHQLKQHAINTLAELHRVITPALESDDYAVVGRLSKILLEVVKAFPPQSNSAPCVNFYKSISETIESGLQQQEKGKFFSSIIILKTICSASPELLDQYLPSLIRLLQKLTKEHCSPISLSNNSNTSKTNNTNSNNNNTNNDNSSSNNIKMNDNSQSSTNNGNNNNNSGSNISPPADTSDIILFCIRLINSRIAQQSEHKRAFLSNLFTIIEKSKNEKLLENITKMVRGWILGKDSEGKVITTKFSLTSKEKTNLLLRMVRFEQFPELLALHKEFLDLVYFIYSDNTPTKEKKSERAQLEPGFMMGLRSPDPAIRAKFFKIFHRSIEKTLLGRMNYILATQNWESLGNHFWMKQALDLLLALRSRNLPITWKSESSPRIPSLFYDAPQIFTNSKFKYYENNEDDDIDLDVTNTNNTVESMLEGMMDHHQSGTNSNSGNNDTIMNENVTDPTGGDDFILFTSTKHYSCEQIQIDNQSSNSIELYNLHEEFLKSISKLKQKNLVDSLRDVMNLNEDLSYHLWTNLFPKLWMTFDNNRQKRFFDAFLILIAKEYHYAQRDVYPNVIQALLEGLCKVPLTTTPENQVAFCQIMKFLGKTYNAWYFAIHILEKEYLRLLTLQNNEISTNNQSSSSDQIIPAEFLYALAELYKLLSEDDYYYSMWYHRCFQSGSMACSAILAREFGQWKTAQENFFYLLHAQVKQQSSIPPSTISLISDDNESLFWQDQILECCKRLNQWDTLTDFGKSNNRLDILVDSAWKLNTPDWSIMKEITLQKTPTLPDSSEFLISQCYTLIAEKKISEIEFQLSKIHCKLLEEWNSLPRMPSCAHIPILQQFQKLVELKESTQILEEVNAQNVGLSVSEVKNILLAWRERVPNKWEDILIWGDILFWRQFIFTKINAAYQSLPKSPNTAIPFIGFHETAWSINKFSHIARKHGLIDVCINSLAKIYNLPNIEIQDAFIKLREQLKCYSNIPSHFIKGLDTINNTNLEYFTCQQKAEFFQLKGGFLSKLQFFEEANSAFASSVQLGDQMISQPTGWLSWGHFSDEQFQATQNLSWCECALTCYAKAATFRSIKSRRKLGRSLLLISFKDTDDCKLMKLFLQYSSSLPSWLWISWIPQLLTSLLFKESIYIKSILEKLAKEYPQALFYPLNSFINDYTFKLNNCKIIFDNSSPPSSSSTSNKDDTNNDGDAMMVDDNEPAPPPSTVDDDDIEMTDHDETGSVIDQGNSSNSSTSTTGFINVSNALQIANEILNSMKKQFSTLVNEMSLLSKEFELSFTPQGDVYCVEELKFILENCLRFFSSNQNNKDDHDKIISYLSTIKQQIQELQESEPFCSVTSNSNHKINESDQNITINDKFSDDFEFLSSKSIKNYKKNNESFDNLKNQLIQTLKKWIEIFFTRFTSISNTIPLSSLSLVLQQFENKSSIPIEIPGCYLDDIEPNPDSHPSILRFLSNVEILEPNSSFGHYKISIQSDDGNIKQFFIKSSNFYSKKNLLDFCDNQCDDDDHHQDSSGHFNRLFSVSYSEERFSRLLNRFNYFCVRNYQMRSRVLSFTNTTRIPISSNVQLLQSEDNYSSLQQIWNWSYNNSSSSSSENHKSSSFDTFPSIQFLEYYYSLKNQLMSNNHVNNFTNDEMNLHLFDKICETVPPTILSDFIDSVVPSYRQLFSVRKQFASQLGLISILSYLFCIGERKLDNFLFSVHSGRIHLNSFFPNYDNQYKFHQKSSVPFRLSRNQNTFINPFGVCGPFSSAMHGFCLTLDSKKDSIQEYIHLFLRDDIISWGISNSKLIPSLSTLESCVNDNFEQIISKAKELSPAQATTKSGEIYLKMQDLIQQASNPTNIANMPPSSHPWF